LLSQLAKFFLLPVHGEPKSSVEGVYVAVQILHQNGCIVVHPATKHLGRTFLAANAASIREQLGGSEPVIFDAGDIQTVDGAGLGALLILLRLCEPQHEFLLSNVPPTLASGLQLAGISSLFTLFDSVDDALEYAIPLLRLRRAVDEQTVPTEVLQAEEHILSSG